MSGQVIGSLKHALNGVYSGGTPTAGDDSFYSDDGDPFVTIGDMSSQFPITSTLRRVTPLGVQDKNLRKVKSGTVLVSMYATIGLPNILATDAYINQAILALTPSQNVDSRFLYYWLMHLRPSLVSTVSGSTQGNLNAEKVKNADFPFLELPTQKAIADFLDRETARIDQLIEKKQRLVELLEEKQEATFQDVLLHGLESETAEAESCDWVLSVKSMLQLLPLKRVAQVVGGYAFSSDDLGDVGVPVIRIGDLGPQMDTASMKRYGREDTTSLQSFEVRMGDILIAMTASLGKVAVYKSNESALLNQRVGLLRTSGINRDYLFGFLQSQLFREQIQLFAIGGAQPNIGVAAIGSIRIPIPGSDEQSSAAAILNELASEIEALKNRISRTIELLQEFRSSLITMAVTGQIELLEWNLRKSSPLGYAIEREVVAG